MTNDHPDYRFTAYVQTLGADNLVIDKLVTTAYTEERRVIANNGPSAVMLAPKISYRRGKYFPRGCRGFIHEIEVYCDNPDAADHNLYIYVSPQPGMAPIISTSLTVPAGSSPAWRSKTVNYYWNYDSLFVWVLGETNDYPRVGYDTGEPYDYFYSTDGETWIPGNYRWWIRLNMAGQTVGDLPVTGTLNTVEVPAVSTERLYASNDNLPTTLTTLKEIHGAGTVEYVYARVAANTDSHRTILAIYCDGNCAFSWTFEGFYLNGYTASTPGISLLSYAENGLCVVHITLKFSFRRSFRIAMQAVGTGGQSVVVDGLANLII